MTRDKHYLTQGICIAPFIGLDFAEDHFETFFQSTIYKMRQNSRKQTWVLTPYI